MKVFFSVGEPSGDHHAARLISEIRRSQPSIECIGFGGPLMRSAGCRIDFQLTDLAVMGILKVLPLIQKFRSVARQAEAIFASERPDAVILVDFPGFNWWIARAAKKHGIQVFYYCPPQLWAWAPWRIHKVRKFVNHVLACLPFEAEWYRSRGISVDCVGHPFFDDVLEKQLDRDFLEEQQGLEGRIVAILPGSRTHEVQSNFPIQLQVAHALHRQFPDIRFIVANYKESQRAYCENQTSTFSDSIPIQFYVGKTSEILHMADCCLMVSGSVSLETLARTVPSVVQYQCDWLLALAGKLLVTCKFISLPNLIAGRMLMPEFLFFGRDRRQMPKMVAQLGRWLANPFELAAQRRELFTLKSTLVQDGATETAARIILEKLDLLPRQTIKSAA